MIARNKRPHYRRFPRTLSCGLMALTLGAGRCGDKPTPLAKPLAFAKGAAPDRGRLEKDLAEMTSAPHPLGSSRQAELAEFWHQRAASEGFQTIVRPFEAATPNPVLLTDPSALADLTQRRIGRNVFAFSRGEPAAPCVILLASHYDTKDISGLSYVGANDSASSSALLLPLLKASRDYAAREKLGCDIGAVWFDGEESVLPEWSDGEVRHPAKSPDHTYGSRFEAQQLLPCADGLCLPSELGGQRLAALIVLDMVGSPSARLTPDSHSSTHLRDLLRTADEALFGGTLVTKGPSVPIEDDHVAFKNRGIPVLNMIDFEHRDYWHAPGDTLANLSLESMEKVFRLALTVTLTLAHSPKG